MRRGTRSPSRGDELEEREARATGADNHERRGRCADLQGEQRSPATSSREAAGADKHERGGRRADSQGEQRSPAMSSRREGGSSGRRVRDEQGTRAEALKETRILSNSEGSGSELWEEVR
ncbi:hypothetical protein PR202_ga02991 [Eleusine coracana subsp. coracana]|uniref:Uncharacterized protein n=1 Tax=Eleusine coracana subsp. coracana TaxID=191504 RepID=A0AAV5BL75_ELECO|nr:hypothetical protein PR202_ga02991 [Eleusine coracana subsp. coracana]